MQLFKPALLAVALFAAAGQAVAATDTTTFNVRITIVQSCTISATAATDVDFGSVNGNTTANADAQGSVTARCSQGTPYNIGLNAGANASTANDINTRRMKHTDGSNNFVPYQLYRDSARTLVWGNTIGTDTQAGTGNGADQAYPVYGRVTSANINAAVPGAYLDTVTATITY